MKNYYLIEQVIYGSSNSPTNGDVKNKDLYFIDSYGYDIADYDYNIDEYNDSCMENDCEVFVYKYIGGGDFELVVEKFFRYHEEIPENIKELYIEVDYATYEPYGHWLFEISINGRKYKRKTTNQDIYYRYKAMAYDDLEFVYYFFPEVIEEYFEDIEVDGVEDKEI